MKITLEQKYNHCLALNIELEEIIDMQNIELMKKDREIKTLESQVNYFKGEVIRYENEIRS